ncbi:MAG TPA: M13-type metalloendopeptidase [Rhizomicrobium sp.]|jgi:putative endopeptidase|nr:M13-type metalloendopeptidase [Rhizomicrobium sp.]
MTRISTVLAGFAVAAALCAGQAAEGDNPFAPWGYDLSARDAAVKPGDDFFAYANGAWLKRTEIPADRSNWGMHAALAERVLVQLRAIMEDAAKADPNSVAGKVGAYYTAFMDEGRVEQLGAAPLKSALDAVRAANSREALAALMGLANKDFEGSLFSVGVAPDAKDPSHYAIYVSQSGLGLPDRDYYLQPSFAEKKAAYQAYVARILSLEGWPDAGKNAAAIVALETRIADASWTRVQERDVVATYNAMSLADLEKRAPGFDWAGFMKANDLGAPHKLVVVEKGALPKLAQIFAATGVDTLKAWAAFNIGDDATPYLSKAFADAAFEFRGKALSGQAEQRPRWKRAVHTVGGGDILFGQRSEIYGCMLWAVGDLYVAKHFPAATKAKAEAQMRNLKDALRARIERLTWMSPQTKKTALAKLDTLTIKIGSGPDKRDYSKLAIARDDLFGDARRVGAFEWAIQAARPGQAVDREEWEETPQTVNDYEDPIRNEVAFPAAYLQAPFFDPNADPAVNYGAAGLMAHELTHGFDDEGRQFDAQGRLSDWWTPSDAATFGARIKVLGAQYDAYQVLPGVHVNGNLTMGENIADLGGLLIAYDAYHKSLGGKPAPVLDGLTGDQRFFLGWAQDWRYKIRDDAARQRIVSDPHAPAAARTVIPLQNIDAWYAAFDVKPGDKSYVAPDKRVRIW